MAKRQRQKRQERRRHHAKREGWTTRHSVITGAAITAGGMLGVAQPALADDFTVNSTADNGDGVCQDVVTGDCTLRDAIDDANSDSGYSYISFASSVTGTITLGSELEITEPTYIYGPGAGTLTVSGDNNYRVFDLFMNYTGDSVYISGLTIADGSAGAGGGIFDYNSSLYLTHSVLTGNDAFVGGALYENGYANYGRNTFVTFSTLNDNSAAYGGAITPQYSWGLIGASTFENNQANRGGAIITDLGGGGFLLDSTVSGNHAYYEGGILAFYAYAGDSIIANNTGTYPDVYSPFFYSNFNLVENPSGTVLNGVQNITGLDPQLGGLAGNGGPTPTLKPAAGSPVVDKGNSYGPGVDQRGFTRPVDNPQVTNAPGGDATDIGAVELTLGEGPQPPAPPVVHKKKKCKKKKKKHSAAQSAKKKKCKKKKKHAAGAVASGGQPGPYRSAWRAEVQSLSGHHVRRAVRQTRPHAKVDWADQAWWNGH